MSDKGSGNSSFVNSPGTARTQSAHAAEGQLTGRYVYCMLEGEVNLELGNIGINDLPVQTIAGAGVTAVVSPIAYRQTESNVQHVMAHQRVVEEARKVKDAVVLPVRFGVVINGDTGVKKLLQNSAPQYKEKMRQLHDKEELGVKVLLNGAESLAQFRKSVELESAAIQKLKDEISSSPNKGRAYFLKMKLQDALKTETLRKIDDMSSVIHQELVGMADRSVKLRSDVNQVILNASYLVDRSKVAAFEQKVLELRQQFAARGLTIHTSGPWAPYSFC